MVWTIVVFYAFVIPSGDKLQFFLLAAAIGVVLGGSQALSRSLFSQFIPFGREAEYFGLYEISDRATSFVGSLMITLTLQVTGSYRLAILGLVVFFVVGFGLLTKVDVPGASGRPATRSPPWSDVPLSAKASSVVVHDRSQRAGAGGFPRTPADDLRLEVRRPRHGWAARHRRPVDDDAGWPPQAHGARRGRVLLEPTPGPRARSSVGHRRLGRRPQLGVVLCCR